MTILEKQRDYQHLTKMGFIHAHALRLIELKERFLNGWELEVA